MTPACPSSSWLLANATVAEGPFERRRVDLLIEEGRIRLLRTGAATHSSVVRRLDVGGLLLLPGLINAHDHLEFGIFPRLGRGPYDNAKAWALDICRPDQSPVRQLLEIPKAIRLFWGGLKNLFAGVTTVCHHNPYEAEVFENNFPVRVMKSYGWTHSLDFSSDPVTDFNQSPCRAPFFVHVGEGSDAASRQEIYELDKLGLLNERTVLIHGVALGPKELALVHQRQAGLVWCPTSNLFTLGRTLEPDVLHSGIPVALGSDSPLTSEGDLIHEIRYAAGLHLPAETIYSLVTRPAATLLRLDQGEGTLAEGGVADVLAIKDKEGSPAECVASLAHSDIQLVMKDGKVQLVSEGLASRLSSSDIASFTRLSYGHVTACVAADLSSPWLETARRVGGKFRLGGKPLALC